jgi:endonuclease/exonuclease/phosphatase family metal-dependent hydrolase
MNRLFVVLAIFILWGCGKKAEEKISEEQSQEITVGTFNIEWLGDGINDRIDRSEQDYKNIAEVIKQSGVDLLGVEEVENMNAMAKVIRYLPDYSFFLSRDDAPQKVGILFKKNIQIRYLYDYSPLEVEQRRTRPGFVAVAQKGNLDFIVMVVHFKATSRFDETPEKLEQSRILRSRQSEITVAWIDSILKAKNEQDVVVLGDFNDSPLRKKYNTMGAFLSYPDVLFLTDNLKSCKYPKAYGIDHIVVTRSLLNRYVQNSTKVFDTFSMFKREDAERISDHCLVFVRFDITKPDNDPSKYFGNSKQIAEK